MTGAASGIGLASSKRLAVEGATVAMLDRAEDALGEARRQVGQLGGSALTLALDLRSRGATVAAFAEIVAKLGEVDILVNRVRGGVAAIA